MQKLGEGVKLKVLLGYFFLLLIASVTVWLIYSELRQPSDIRTYMKPLNEKALYVNKILADLYEAEGLERAYFQTGQSQYYERYNTSMNEIDRKIDSLVSISESPAQQSHIDTIKVLILKKRKNLQELVKIKRAGSSDEIYRQALARLAYNEDSLNYYIRVYKTVSDSLDSTYIKQERKRFLDRLINVFSPGIYSDSVLQVNVTKSVQVDSVLNRIPADSINVLLSSIIDDIREKSIEVERQLSVMETGIMQNNQTITMQMRQILTSLEEEAIAQSYNELEAFHGRIKQMTGKIIILGAAAFLTILLFMILILKDISEAKHYRTKLEAAKAYAESLLKSKEQFMLNITHDLKTPLGTIMGYARLMSASQAENQKKYYLENINRAADHILRLIHDLVDFAKLETGKFSFDNVPVNLRSLMDETISAFCPAAVNKKLNLKMICKGDVEKIYRTDPVRLKQVLGNLLSNAIKFTDQGEVLLSVSVVESYGNTDVIRFQIKDTGIGISEEYQKIIFNEFSRVHYKDRNYEGTGLGLTISQRIVSLLRGTITVKSRPGEGSLFTVQLPFEKTQEPVRQAIPQYLNESVTGKKNLLLIDDDEILLNLTAEILEKANISVTRCNHPVRAKQLLDNKYFDIVLTDINMPSMTGFDILSMIREKRGSVPVFAITGTATMNREDFPGLGFTGVINKPYTPEQLINAIMTVLNDADRTSGIAAPDNAGPFYNLEHIIKFTSGDSMSTNLILTSFIESTAKHIELFRKYLNENNRGELSDLAHKMLSMFRQIEAKQISVLLASIEKISAVPLEKAELHRVGAEVLLKIEKLMERITEEHGITN